MSQVLALTNRGSQSLSALSKVFQVNYCSLRGRQIKSLALQMRGVEPLLRKRKAFKADLRKPAARERAEALPAGPTLGLTSLKWPRILEGQVLCWPFLHPSS